MIGSSSGSPEGQQDKTVDNKPKYESMTVKRKRKALKKKIMSSSPVLLSSQCPVAEVAYINTSRDSIFNPADTDRDSIFDLADTNVINPEVQAAQSNETVPVKPKYEDLLASLQKPVKTRTWISKHKCGM